MKTISTIAAILLSAVVAAMAQVVPLGPRFVLPYQTVIDSTGAPIPGALLYFYQSGTSTPLNTYSDPLLTVPNANPVAANAAGVFPTIFLNGNYKIVMTDSSNNQIWTADPVYGVGASIGPGPITAALQRSVTTAPVVIFTTDQILNLNLAAPGTIVLPSYLSRSGVALLFKDVGNQATANPQAIQAATGEFIDGTFSSIPLNTNGQAIRLVPANDGVNTGWNRE